MNWTGFLKCPKQRRRNQNAIETAQDRTAKKKVVDGSAT